MSEQTDIKPQTTNRKIIQAVVLFTILALLPALSYYYLYSGAKKQKSMQEELARSYGQIPSVKVVYDGNIAEDQTEGNVCVIYYFGENPQLTETSRKVLDVGQELFDLYNNTPSAPYLRLVMVSGGGSADFKSYAQTRPSSDYVTWAWSGALGKWKGMLFNAFEYFEKEEDFNGDVADYFALADTSGVVRRFYKVMDQKDLNKMRNHIGYLIPKE